MVVTTNGRSTMPSLTSPSTPDLTAFTVIHRVMRADGRRFADIVAALDEAERVQRVPRLARWWTGYQDELHDHHVIEDEFFYPALVERVPTAARHIERIDVDHEHLGDLIARITDVFVRLGDPAAPFRATHAEAVRLTDGLASLLEAHLGFEDEDVVPLFAEHFTGAEYEALEKQAMKRPSLRRAAFTVPWVLAGASDAEREHLLATAPGILKLLWYVSRGRYRRLADEVFGPAAPADSAVAA
jgi:hemerythrin-like domain-containing protein